MRYSIIAGGSMIFSFTIIGILVYYDLPLGLKFKEKSGQPLGYYS
jgi:hypothetical protein